MFTARVAIRLLFSHTFSDHAVVSNTRDLYSVARLARCTGYYSSEEIVTSWTQNCREIVLRRRTQTASSPRWISPMPKDTNYTTKMEFLLYLWSLGMHHLKRNYLDTLWQNIREWKCSVYLDLTHLDTFWPWFLIHPESATKRRMLVTTSRLIHFVVLSECDDVVFTLTQQHLDTSWPWFL
jgi:hypothetical protein